VRRATLAALLALAVAGCGSGDDEVSVPRATPTAIAPLGATTPATTAEAAPVPAAGPARPRIVPRPIPYGARRRAQMAAYSQRHYGEREWRLEPVVIVQHWTSIASVDATWRLFARNRRDSELGELPGTCSHFLVGRSGTIFQLVDEGVRCRHAFGVNHVSLGIEHIGFSDGEVMGNPRQLAASLRLTRWLACRHGIQVRDVLGHGETGRSHWWTEVRPERHSRDTHTDFSGRTMRRYRARLARTDCG